MPKPCKKRRKVSCPQDESDGDNCCSRDCKDQKSNRNCYTIECCDEKLIKAQSCLQSLIDCKRQLEDELDKSLDEIKCLNARIADLECRIEKLVASQAAKECQQRMKDEICLIKQERKKTEADLKHYKRKLSEKLERLKQCTGDEDCRS